MLNSFIVIDLSKIDLSISPYTLILAAAFASLVPIYIAWLYLESGHVPLIGNIKKHPHRKSRAAISLCCIVLIELVVAYYAIILTDLAVGRLHLIELALLTVFTIVQVPFTYNLLLSMSLGMDMISNDGKPGHKDWKLALSLITCALLAIVCNFTSFAIFES